ncbi:MAG: porin [Candidatus Margulisiibacteriota bacterium]
MKNRVIGLLALSLVLFAAVPARAVNVDELLLDQLVAQGVVSAETAAALRADAALKTYDEKALVTAFPVNGKSKINVSGTMQVLYGADETANVADNLKVRRARLDFKGDVSRQVGYELQIDAVQPYRTVVETVTQTGTGAVTSKTTRVINRPIILDAYVVYYLLEGLDLKAGQIKVPFGRENLESDAKLDTINRSQVTERLVPDRDNGSQGRDLGAQLGGALDLGGDEKVFEYAVGAFNGSGLIYDEDNERKDLCGRLVYYPFPGASLGLARYEGWTGTTEATKLRAGLEATLALGKTFFKGEYITGKDGSTDKLGWYALAGVKVRPDLELVYRLDSYDSNTALAGDRSNIATCGLNWYLNKMAKVQANYEIKAEETVQVKNNALSVQATVTF